MVRELMQDLKTYFNNIKNPSERERQLLKQLNAGYFVITSVHRNDLARTGFDVEKISDNDMDKLAEKMADDYCKPIILGKHGNNSFRNSWFSQNRRVKRKSNGLIQKHYGKI